MSVARFARAITLLFIATATVLVSTGAASAAPYGKTSPLVAVANPGPCAGTPVSTSGQGFQPNESVSVYRDGSLVTTVTANAAGSFSTSVGTDGVNAGSDHSITATGAVTGTSAVTGFSVTTSGCSDASTTTTSSSSATGGSTSGLAFTGARVLGLGIVAAVTLFGGILLAFLGRRRRQV